jgi:hypothetical protein
MGFIDDTIVDGMHILPWTEPHLHHFSREVLRMKAQGEDHSLFHFPPGLPLAEIKRLMRNTQEYLRNQWHPTDPDDIRQLQRLREQLEEEGKL